MKVEPEFVGKTYNDFLIRPRMGVVDSRREVALTSPLTTRLRSHSPDSAKIGGEVIWD